MRKSILKKGISIALICASITSLVGCSSISYLSPFDSKQSSLFSLKRGEDLYVSNSLASDLCVILDEDKFNSNDIQATGAGLFNITSKETLYSKNAFMKLAPASLTKIMTALVALKYGNLEDEVTVGNEVVITEPDAWLCKIAPGDTFTLEQLINAMLVYSGNDMAAAIAVHISGSISEFTKLMNQEAKALGATGSNFMNPHGLDQEMHYSTVYDMYLIFNECLKYEKFTDMIRQKSYTCTYKSSNGEEITATWKNTNGYFTTDISAPEGVYVVGGKTGNTQNAGRCLVLLSESEQGASYVSVIFNAQDYNMLYEQMNVLLEKIK